MLLYYTNFNGKGTLPKIAPQWVQTVTYLNTHFDLYRELPVVVDLEIQPVKQRCLYVVTYSNSGKGLLYRLPRYIDYSPTHHQTVINRAYRQPRRSIKVEPSRGSIAVDTICSSRAHYSSRWGSSWRRPRVTPEQGHEYSRDHEKVAGTWQGSATVLWLWLKWAHVPTRVHSDVYSGSLLSFKSVSLGNTRPLFVVCGP